MFVKFNGDSADIKPLMKEMSVIGYPSFIVLNAEGATLDRWYGYEKPMFLENALAAVKDPVTIEEKFARYEANPTAGDAAKLAGYHDSRGESMEAVELFRAAAGMDPDDDYAMPIFQATFYGVRKEKMEQGDLVASADAVFSAPKPEPMDMLNVAMMMSYMGRRADDPTMGVPYVKSAIERTEGAADEEVVETRKDILPEYAMLVLKDEAKAVAFKKDTYSEDWTEEPDELNSFAWWCFSNKVNLEEAQSLAARGADLAEAGKPRAMILDTLAEICHARGDTQAAIAHMKDAMKEDPDSEQYAKQLERFEQATTEGGGGQSEK